MTPSANPFSITSKLFSFSPLLKFHMTAPPLSPPKYDNFQKEAFLNFLKITNKYTIAFTHICVEEERQLQMSIVLEISRSRVRCALTVLTLFLQISTSIFIAKVGADLRLGLRFSRLPSILNLSKTLPSSCNYMYTNHKPYKNLA